MFVLCFKRYFWQFSGEHSQRQQRKKIRTFFCFTFILIAHNAIHLNECLCSKSGRYFYFMLQTNETHWLCFVMEWNGMNFWNIWITFMEMKERKSIWFFFRKNSDNFKANTNNTVFNCSLIWTIQIQTESKSAVKFKPKVNRGNVKWEIQEFVAFPQINLIFDNCMVSACFCWVLTNYNDLCWFV